MLSSSSSPCELPLSWIFGMPFSLRLLRSLRAEGAFRPAFWHWLETKMSCCRAEFRSHTWLRPVFDGDSGVIV